MMRTVLVVSLLAIELAATAAGEGCAVGDFCDSALCFHNTAPKDRADCLR